METSVNPISMKAIGDMRAAWDVGSNVSSNVMFCEMSILTCDITYPGLLADTRYVPSSTVKTATPSSSVIPRTIYTTSTSMFAAGMGFPSGSVSLTVKVYFSGGGGASSRDNMSTALPFTP